MRKLMDGKIIQYIRKVEGMNKTFDKNWLKSISLKRRNTDCSKSSTSYYEFQDGHNERTMQQ